MNKQKIVMEEKADGSYASSCGHTMARNDDSSSEHFTRWELRSQDGELIDWDKYRHDMACRNNLTLKSKNV